MGFYAQLVIVQQKKTEHEPLGKLIRIKIYFIDS